VGRSDAPLVAPDPFRPVVLEQCVDTAGRAAAEVLAHDRATERAALSRDPTITAEISPSVNCRLTTLPPLDRKASVFLLEHPAVFARKIASQLAEVVVPAGNSCGPG